MYPEQVTCHLFQMLPPLLFQSEQRRRPAPGPLSLPPVKALSQPAVRRRSASTPRKSSRQEEVKILLPSSDLATNLAKVFFKRTPTQGLALSPLPSWTPYSSFSSSSTNCEYLGRRSESYLSQGEEKVTVRQWVKVPNPAFLPSLIPLPDIQEGTICDPSSLVLLPFIQEGT